MLQRLETACATLVERSFALVFPAALEPVVIARKLVAASESSPIVGVAGRSYTVTLNPSDVERFAGERAYFEERWSTMLADLAARAGRIERLPIVALVGDRSVPTGTVMIEVAAREDPVALALRMRGARERPTISLVGTLTLGRDPASDIVVPDPRVSRHHATITGGEIVAIADAGSSNGTFVNDARITQARLHFGDTVTVGDTVFVVESRS